MIFSKYIGSHTDEYGRNYVTYMDILIGVIGLVFLHFSDGVVLLSLGALLLAFALAFLGPIFIAYQDV
ncbi:MAG: hypothetical protein U9O24_05345 [Campylobacterota bacterium]|nr:hypothetical protein [Campylobacterota bacterium]